MNQSLTYRVLEHILSMAWLKLISCGQSQLSFQLLTGLLKVVYIVFVTYWHSKCLHFLTTGAKKRWCCSRLAPGNCENCLPQTSSSWNKKLQPSYIGRVCSHAPTSNFCTLGLIYCEARVPSDNNWCIEVYGLPIINYIYQVLIIGIRNYMLLQAHCFRQPHVITCSPVDTLPSGPSSKFRQRFCATAHSGEENIVR